MSWQLRTEMVSPKLIKLIDETTVHRASAEESQHSWAVCLLTFCETSFEFAELVPHLNMSYYIILIF